MNKARLYGGPFYLRSVILMYSLSMNFTCFVKSLSLSFASSEILSCSSGSNRSVFVIVSFFSLFIMLTSCKRLYYIMLKKNTAYCKLK